MVGLYPNLDSVNVSKIAAEVVKSTKLKIQGVDFKLLAIYLCLVIGTEGMIKRDLADCIPKKKDQKQKSRSLSGKYNKDPNNWSDENLNFTEGKKRIMLSLMVQIMCLLLSSSTCYKFGGRIFRQRKGLGIGLRASAALARLTMCVWDNRWALTQKYFGLTLRMFFRYVDDVRMMLKPIVKGWTWGSKGWYFDPQSQDERDPDRRTIEEVGKSLNDVWKFLKFTTEGEAEFEESFLPTLDFSTQVLESGYVRYKFFSKPMSSNLVLMKSTALSATCIFSSLRQELLRRLYNTDFREGYDERIRVTEEFIKLLVNSGHAFQYVKSVILQALTKYTFVVYRSSVGKDHKLYSPIHRARDYQVQERKLMKYTDQALWYTDKIQLDKHKDVWKRWVTRKETYWRKQHKISAPNARVTTAMFVPCTPGAKLLNRLQKVEDELAPKTGWKAKMVERPGVPLLRKFIKSFPMVNGCSRQQICGACEDNGIKCTTKRVVYEAKCMECNVKESGVCEPGIYIGETARQLGERVSEHKDKAEAFSKESFVIRHWMTGHGNMTQAPKFKFRIVSCHKDALSRQIKEAVLIRHKGNLNMKNEFGNNEIIRVAATTYSWEERKEQQIKRQEEKDLLDNLNNFVMIMKNVNKQCHYDSDMQHTPNGSYFSRSDSIRDRKRDLPATTPTRVEKKRKKMSWFSSTPVSYREKRDISSSLGEISSESQELSLDLTRRSEDEICAVSGGEDSGQMVEQKFITRKVSEVVFGTPEKESRAVTIARHNVGANESMNACMEYRKRLYSLPALKSKPFIMKKSTLGENNRSLSMDEDMWDECMKDSRFKGNTSDKHSFEVEDILNDMDLIGIEDVHRLFMEGSADEIEKHFEEDADIDKEVEKEMSRRSKNALYCLFKKAKAWEPTASDSSKPAGTPVKRKALSPEKETPPARKSRIDLMELGSPVTPGDRARIHSVGRQGKPKKLPTRKGIPFRTPGENSQSLITAFMERKRQPDGSEDFSSGKIDGISNLNNKE